MYCFIVQAPIAVGVTALSSEDMYMSGGRGRCVDIIHVIGDQLCQSVKNLERPQLNQPAVTRSEKTISPESLSEEVKDLNVEDDTQRMDDAEFSEAPQEQVMKILVTIIIQF